jgi:carbonic anhydrase
LRGNPELGERVKTGKLSLHGAYFDIDDGRLLALDEASGDFVQIAARRHESATSAAAQV